MNGRQPVTTTDSHPIDPDTGLPELPEGQWWEVREVQNFGYMIHDYEHGAPSVEVAIMAEMTVSRSVEKKGRWPWSKPKTETVMAPKDAALASRWIDRDDAEAKWKYVHRTDLKAEDIRRSAEELVEAERIKAEAAKLLGKYPPKKLAA